MPPLVAEITALDALWIALAVFCLAVGLSLAYVLFRLAATVRRLASFLQGLEHELLPVISKAGGTVDRVNAQLDKVDHVTTSAVDAADSVDAAVRTVAAAIRAPVKKISGLAEGISHGIASLRVRRDPRGAWESGREAASRRERLIDEELDKEQP
jgi:uncharacterized protein YoxC